MGGRSRTESWEDKDNPFAFIATTTAKYRTRAAQRGVELLLISYHSLSLYSSNNRGINLLKLFG